VDSVYASVCQQTCTWIKDLWVHCFEERDRERAGEREAEFWCQSSVAPRSEFWVALHHADTHESPAQGCGLRRARRSSSWRVSFVVRVFHGLCHATLALTLSVALPRPECEQQVRGFSGAQYQRFRTLKEAEEFVGNAAISDPSGVSGPETPLAAPPPSETKQDDPLPERDSSKRRKDTAPRVFLKDSLDVSTDKDSLFILHCDGASKGNPGPSGAGALLFEERNPANRLEIVCFLGNKTNNGACHRVLRSASGVFADVRCDSRRGGVLRARHGPRAGPLPQRTASLGVCRLSIGGESSHRRVQGAIGACLLLAYPRSHVPRRTQVKAAHLRPFCARVHELCKHFVQFSVRHHYRESNSEADALANLAIAIGGDSDTAAREAFFPQPLDE
jgi:ribonuclease HI